MYYMGKILDRIIQYEAHFDNFEFDITVLQKKQKAESMQIWWHDYHAGQKPPSTHRYLKSVSNLSLATMPLQIPFGLKPLMWGNKSQAELTKFLMALGHLLHSKRGPCLPFLQRPNGSQAILAGALPTFSRPNIQAPRTSTHWVIQVKGGVYSNSVQYCLTSSLSAFPQSWHLGGVLNSLMTLYRSIWPKAGEQRHKANMNTRATFMMISCWFAIRIYRPLLLLLLMQCEIICNW